MIQQTLSKLFNRDLDLLADEIKAYQKEDQLWILKGEIKNTAWNLCMHLIGNLNHFIGHALGKSAYSRQREHEFSGTESREKLLIQIEETKQLVSQTILNLSNEKMEQNFPIRVFDREHTVSHFLIHLSTHLNYHLGQINYHRRLLKP